MGFIQELGQFFFGDWMDTGFYVCCEGLLSPLLASLAYSLEKILVREDTGGEA